MLEKLDTLGACLLAVLMAGTFLFFVIAHSIGFQYCKKLFGTRRITQQNQEIPLEGDLFAACYIRTNQPRVLDQHIHHELLARPATSGPISRVSWISTSITSCRLLSFTAGTAKEN